MPDFCAKIIDRLIAERHSKGMTQRELARAASVPPLAIARLESKSNRPRLDTLVKVAMALECDIAIVPNN